MLLYNTSGIYLCLPCSVYFGYIYVPLIFFLNILNANLVYFTSTLKTLFLSYLFLCDVNFSNGLNLIQSDLI